MKRKIKFQKAKIIKKLEIEMRYVKEQLKRKINKKSLTMEKLNVEILQTQKGITLLVLVITIVLNSSYLAMDRINKIEKI